MESFKQWNKVRKIQYNFMVSLRYHNSCLDILVYPFYTSWAFKSSPSAQCGICAKKFTSFQFSSTLWHIQWHKSDLFLGKHRLGHQSVRWFENWLDRQARPVKTNGWHAVSEEHSVQHLDQRPRWWHRMHPEQIYGHQIKEWLTQGLAELNPERSQ